MNEMKPHLDSETGEPPVIARPVNILIVDDDGFDREHVRRLCHQTGLEVNIHEAATVPEMTVAVNSVKFDLILVDYYLGSSNGIDVLKEIKAHPINNSAATIMIAGKWQTEKSRTAINLGCNDYIEKDCLEAVTIQRAIVEALRTSRSQDPEELYESEDTSIGPMLRALNKEFAETISPHLSSGISQIEQIRSARVSAIDVDTSACLSEIEASCWRLMSATNRLNHLRNVS